MWSAKCDINGNRLQVTFYTLKCNLIQADRVVAVRRCSVDLELTLNLQAYDTRMRGTTLDTITPSRQH